jgi:hypothetical protein
MNTPIEKIDQKTRLVSMVVPLEYPIKTKSELGAEIQVYQVELGRLKVKHLKILPVSFLDDTLDMSPADMRLVTIAMTGLSESVADEIDLVDCKTIVSTGIDMLKK